MPAPRSNPNRLSLPRFIAMSLVLGFTGFGGGYAIIGRIKSTVVDQRRWSSEENFLEDAAVGSALPGATAANVITLVGYRLGGVRAALAGVIGFVLPSMLLMIAFGAGYDHLQRIRPMEGAFDTMSAAMVGIVAATVLELRAVALKSRGDWLIAIPAALAIGARVLTLLEVVVVAGMVGVFLFRPPAASSRGGDPSSLGAWLAPAFTLVFPLSVLASLFFVFAKIGVATFGGGLAMIPAIAHEVTARGWLDERAFRDAISLSQVTPGPVAIGATFIGFRVAGLAGALSASLGVFGAPFVVCILAGRSMVAFRESVVLQGFLRGISPAVVGIIAAASYSLFVVSIHTRLGGALAAGAFALRLLFPRLNPALLILAAAMIGALL